MFDKFGPESGRAFFELFFWMFDNIGATKVDIAAVTSPVMCVAGVEDKMVSLETARATTAGYSGATFWELQGRGLCWCWSLAPKRSRAASPDGFQPKASRSTPRFRQPSRMCTIHASSPSTAQ